MSELAHSIYFIGVDVEELLKQKVYGDIVLTPEQEKFLITDREPSLVQGFFNRANKWPNATVPYVLDSAFNSRLSELENLLNMS